jgi:uncharacterized protein YpuA (DUF1002 family)
MAETKHFDMDEFFPDWLKEQLARVDDQHRKQFLENYESAVKELLKNLESLPMNEVDDGTGRGKLQAIIPGTNISFNIRSSLWTLAVYGATLVLAGTVAAPVLATVGVTLSGTIALSSVVTAIKAVKDAFAKLNSVEMDIYNAVLAAIDRNRMKVLRSTGGATLEQVLESFKLDKELMRPDNPRAVLDDLAGKKVLTRSASGGDWLYSPAFSGGQDDRCTGSVSASGLQDVASSKICKAASKSPQL